ARRTPCTLSVQPRAPQNVTTSGSQLGPYRRPARLLVVVLVPLAADADHADHGLVVDVEDPAERIDPGFLGLALYLGPVPPRQCSHQGRIDGPLVGVVQQHLDLLLRAADADLAPEAEAAVPGLVLDFRVLSQILENFLLELLFVASLLVPPHIAAVGGEGPGDLNLLRDRPARRLLDDGSGGRAGAHEEPARNDHSQA